MRKLIPLFVIILSTVITASAQVKYKLDTLQCSNVGFSVGAMMPSKAASFSIAPDGSHSSDATMHSLYKGPYMNYGINYSFKTKKGWLFSADANLIMGSNNLTHRTERMPNIFTQDNASFIIGTNGTDANVTCYNRGISVTAGMGKIFTIIPKQPNSGPFVRANLGLFQQQTIFFPQDVEAPQVDNDYEYLYDHQRRGFILAEEFGYWYMSNNSNLVNFHVSLEISQHWTHPTRQYIIDEYLNLAGPDNNKYFDMVYMLKLCWMFPLTGKPSQEFYYY